MPELSDTVDTEMLGMNVPNLHFQYLVGTAQLFVLTLKLTKPFSLVRSNSLT
jgi:hypothetical protein